MYLFLTYRNLSATVNVIAYFFYLALEISKCGTLVRAAFRRMIIKELKEVLANGNWL